jgi:hypothetical protein
MSEESSEVSDESESESEETDSDDDPWVEMPEPGIRELFPDINGSEPSDSKLYHHYSNMPGSTNNEGGGELDGICLDNMPPLPDSDDSDDADWNPYAPKPDPPFKANRYKVTDEAADWDSEEEDKRFNFTIGHVTELVDNIIQMIEAYRGEVQVQAYLTIRYFGVPTRNVRGFQPYETFYDRLHNETQCFVSNWMKHTIGHRILYSIPEEGEILEYIYVPIPSDEMRIPDDNWVPLIQRVDKESLPTKTLSLFECQHFRINHVSPPPT